LDEGDRFCRGCGGTLEGSSVNYSHPSSRLTDLYDQEAPESATRDFIYPAWGDYTLLRFTVLLILFPLFAAFFFAAGHVYGISDFYYVGAFILLVGIVLVAISYKYVKRVYKPKNSTRERVPEAEEDSDLPPLFSRKV
jgi:hypothetical protein